MNTQLHAFLDSEPHVRGYMSFFEHWEIRWHLGMNTSSSSHVPVFFHTTPHSLFSKNSFKDWICLLLSLSLSPSLSKL
jgi:hypothetical protein